MPIISRLVVWQLSSERSECFVYNKEQKCVSLGEFHFNNITSGFLDDRITFRIQSSIAVCAECGNGDG